MTDDQPPPAPPRRDDPSPAAGHHGPPPNERLRDVWLAEMWAPVREFHPATEPAKKAKKGRRKRSTDSPAESPSISTGCAEIGHSKMPGSAA